MRRGRRKTLCARGADSAAQRGRSTSPLEHAVSAIAQFWQQREISDGDALASRAGKDEPRPTWPVATAVPVAGGRYTRFLRRGGWVG